MFATKVYTLAFPKFGTVLCLGWVSITNKPNEVINVGSEGRISGSSCGLYKTLMNGIVMEEAVRSKHSIEVMWDRLGAVGPFVVQLTTIDQLSANSCSIFHASLEI